MSAGALVLNRGEYTPMSLTTKIIALSDENMTSEALAEILKPAAALLAADKTVAFPTETVYGLGANALSDAAIDEIYLAKGRPSDNPLIVHIASLDMLALLAAEVKSYARELMAAFWPGPITFVFKKTSAVPMKVTGGLDTVAVRMPDHAVAQTLIALSGKPIAAPSANLSGKPSPTTAAHVIEDLDGRVDCIVAGGNTQVGLESTVLDVTGDVPVILRPGKVTQEEIAAVVGACEIDPAITGVTIDVSGAAKSPGMKYRHYAPAAHVQVYIGTTTDVIRTFDAEAHRLVLEVAGKIGVLTFSEDLEVLTRLFKTDVLLTDRVEFISAGSAKDLSVYGKVLFEALRDFDERGCDVILVRGVEETGLGGAIMNRLKKASEGKVTRI